jgi:hypothetical protein
MNNFKIILTACAVSLTLASTATAETSAKIPKQVRDLHGMVGNWRGTVAMNMGGQKAKLELSINCKLASAGNAVTCKSRFSGAGMVVHETDLFGFDPETGKYHWFAVSSAGETHDHVSDAPKAGTFLWVYRGTKAGKRFVESIRMTINKRAKRIDFRNRTTVAGKTVFTMSGSAHKR